MVEIHSKKANVKVNVKNKYPLALIREWFIVLYMVICIAWMFPLLGDVRSWISWAVSIMGVLLIVGDIFTSRIVFRAKYWYISIAFMVVCGVSTLLNIGGDVTSGIKQMLHSSIFLFLLYMQDPKASEQNYRKLLCRINSIIIAIAFVSAVLSVIMFLMSIGFFIEQDVAIYRVGFLENRLYGVYTSPNIGALFGIISIVSGCINSILKNGKALKWSGFYVANAVFQLFYFILALSNGATLSIVAFTALFCALFVFRKLRIKRNRLMSILLSFACFVGILGGLFAVTTGLKQLFPLLSNAVHKVIGITATEDDIFLDENIKIERVESGEDLSNNRFTIWSAGIKLWEKQPVFGLSHADYNESPIVMTEKMAQSQLTDIEKSWIQKINGNMHNVYLQVLVYSGIMGFVLIGGIILLVMLSYLKYLFRNKPDNEHYLLISIIFCTLAMLLADGFVESHLLFSRQNAIGCIFWVYAGLGLVLINKQDRKDYEQKGKGNYAFVCETPYQALNQINFVLNKTDKDMSSADIYIHHQFASAQVMSDKLKDAGVFQNVIDVHPYLSGKTNLNKMLTLGRILFSKATLKRHVQTGSIDDRGYQFMVCCSYTMLTINLFLLHQPGVFFLEDGTGSYFGNMEKDSRSRIFSFFNRFFINGALDYHPQRLYVNNPALCKSTIAEEVRPLPPLDAQNPALALLETIFDYQDNPAYSQKKTVYLTQPLEEVKGYIAGKHEVMVGMLDPHRDNVLLRIHPRQKNVFAGGLLADEVGNLWELECIRNITDEHVLIGAFSTAQVTPKLLCDKEPYLVFTYKLFFDNLDSEMWCGASGMIEQFKAFYRQTGKLFVPESMDELRRIVDRLAARR